MKGFFKMQWTKRIEWLPLIAAMLMIGVAAMAAKVGVVEFQNDAGAYDSLIYMDRSGDAVSIVVDEASMMTVNATGVGINKTPLAAFHVDAGQWEHMFTDGLYNLRNTNTVIYGKFGIDNYQLAVIAQMGYPIVFKTGASTTTTEKMRLGNSGVLSIGTASPTAGYILHVEGATKITGNASIAGRIYYGKLATAPASPAEGDQFYNSTTHKLQVYDGSAWQNCW